MRRSARSLSAVLAVVGAGRLSAQALTATTHVVIVGGPKAGSYDGESSRAAACSVGADGRGVFTVQVTDPRPVADKFSGLQLIAPNPLASGSSQFLAHVTFGVPGRTTDYIVETRPTETTLTGSGRVAVEDAGSTASVTFYGTTAKGIKFTGSVICKYVMRR
jgi:hypothetical protein